MKRNKEFSKKIFNIIMTLFITVILFSLIMIWKTENLEPLVYIIPSVSGILATSVGFYYWKAKAENIIKMSKDNDMSVAEIQETLSTINDESEVG